MAIMVKSLGALLIKHTTRSQAELEDIYDNREGLCYAIGLVGLAVLGFGFILLLGL